MNEKEVNKIATHPIQSWHWGEFRKKWGNKVLYTKYGLITLHQIPHTKYSIGVFEKGPPPNTTMLKDLEKIGKENNLIFIRLEPNVPFGKPNIKGVTNSKEKEKYINILHKSQCVKGKTIFTPTTFWIDLTKKESELIKSFSSKTRYNIRLAERKGVNISEDNSENAFQKYLDLTFETTNRQGFYAHTPKYHRLMWKFLHESMLEKTPQNKDHHSQKPIAHLLTATYKDEIITTWILFSWKDFLYYPYGASTDKHREVMANNLMMWEAIKFGKKLGLRTFDLWGREEGKGFTRFKEGYNPDVIEFLGSWDLVINKNVYWLYQIAEKVRWKLLKIKTIFRN